MASGTCAARRAAALTNGTSTREPQLSQFPDAPACCAHHLKCKIPHPKVCSQFAVLSERFWILLPLRPTVRIRILNQILDPQPESVPHGTSILRPTDTKLKPKLLRLCAFLPRPAQHRTGPGLAAASSARGAPEHVTLCRGIWCTSNALMSALHGAGVHNNWHDGEGCLHHASTVKH